MNWTETKVAQLKKLFLEGLSFAQIARQLGDGCTRNAALGKAGQLGLDRANAAKPGVPARTGPKATPARPAPAAPILTIVPAAPAPTITPAGSDRLKSLLERGERECAWPVGAPDPVRGQLFCAAATPFRKAYCPAHSPAQAATLKSTDMRDATVRRARVERDECEIDLSERFA